MHKLLEAHRTKAKGVSLKTLTLGSEIDAKKATYAVTLECIKRRATLLAVELSKLHQ